MQYKAAGILPHSRSTSRVLVARRNQHVSAPNTFSLFGGHREEGEEHPRETAEREFREESGFSGPIQLTHHVDSEDGEHRNFVAQTDTEFEPRLDHESQEAVWMTPKELRSKKSEWHFDLEPLLQSIEQMSKYAIEWVDEGELDRASIDEARGSELYHTTSYAALEEILRTGRIEPKSGEAYVSFSERPHLSDISADDVVIALDARKLRDQVEKVEYTEEWFDRNREKASYIAGEGWIEQFNLDDYVDPEDIDPDTGEIDTEKEEEAYREGELEAFLTKSEEREWISRSEGEPVKLDERAIRRILVVNDADVSDVQRRVEQSGMNVEVGALRESIDARSSLDESRVSIPPVVYRAGSVNANKGMIFFTDDIDYAQSYSRGGERSVIEAEITMRDPIDLRRFGSDTNVSSERLSEFLQERGIDVSEEDLSFREAEILQHLSQGKSAGLIAQKTREAGYDGIVLREYNLDAGEADAYVVFDPSQVSVLDTVEDTQLVDARSNLDESKELTIDQIPIERLRFGHPVNDEVSREEYEHERWKGAADDPVIVGAQGTVLNGNRRLQIAISEGRDTIRVIQLPMDVFAVREGQQKQPFEMDDISVAVLESMELQKNRIQRDMEYANASQDGVENALIFLDDNGVDVPDSVLRKYDLLAEDESIDARSNLDEAVELTKTQAEELERRLPRSIRTRKGRPVISVVGKKLYAKDNRAWEHLRDWLRKVYRDEGREKISKSRKRSMLNLSNKSERAAVAEPEKWENVNTHGDISKRSKKLHQTIREAAGKQHKIRMAYRRVQDNELNEYVVEPYSYRFENSRLAPGKWRYLYAYHGKHRKIHKFLFRRIRTIDKTKRKYDARWQVEIQPAQRFNESEIEHEGARYKLGEDYPIEPDELGYGVKAYKRFEEEQDGTIIMTMHGEPETTALDERFGSDVSWFEPEQLDEDVRLDVSPEKLAKAYGFEIEYGNEGRYTGGTIVVSKDASPLTPFAANWAGDEDFKTRYQYPRNVATAAHEIAHGLFSRYSSRAHEALKALQDIGVPQSVAFEALVDLGGLYLLEPGSITDQDTRGIIEKWLGDKRVDLRRMGESFGARSIHESFPGLRDATFLHASDEMFDRPKATPSRPFFLTLKKEGAGNKAALDRTHQRYLYTVRVSNEKEFDPPNDEKARSILEQNLPENTYRRDQAIREGVIPFDKTNDVLPAASESGYNFFKVREPTSERSYAATDPSILEIVDVTDRSEESVEWIDRASMNESEEWDFDLPAKVKDPVLGKVFRIEKSDRSRPQFNLDRGVIEMPPDIWDILKGRKRYGVPATRAIVTHEMVHGILSTLPYDEQKEIVQKGPLRNEFVGDLSMAQQNNEDERAVETLNLYLLDPSRLPEEQKEWAKWAVRSIKKGSVVENTNESHNRDTVLKQLNDYPDTAEDGKAFCFHWADGRAAVAFRNKRDAQNWMQDGDDPDIVRWWYGEPRIGKKRLSVRNQYQSKNNESRDYKQEYRDYHGKPEQIARRSSRNKARRKLKNDGKVKDGDGKDVHHKDGNPHNNDKKNLNPTSVYYNRGKANADEAETNPSVVFCELLDSGGKLFVIDPHTKEVTTVEYGEVYTPEELYFDRVSDDHEQFGKMYVGYWLPKSKTLALRPAQMKSPTKVKFAKAAEALGVEPKQTTIMHSQTLADFKTLAASSPHLSDLAETIIRKRAEAV